MADNTNYLAPKLKDEGYTGSTGNTPYKPANPDQLARLQDLQANVPEANPYRMPSISFADASNDSNFQEAA